jgi:hypothetical protein
MNKVTYEEMVEERKNVERNMIGSIRILNT